MPPRPYSPPPQEFGGEVSGSLDCPRHRESLAQPVPLRVRILPSTAKLYQPASEGRLYRHFTDPKDGWHDARSGLGRRPVGGSSHRPSGRPPGAKGATQWTEVPRSWGKERAPAGGTQRQERGMGFEPTHRSLGSYCLTTWLHPREAGLYRQTRLPKKNGFEITSYQARSVRFSSGQVPADQVQGDGHGPARGVDQGPAELPRPILRTLRCPEMNGDLGRPVGSHHPEEQQGLGAQVRHKLYGGPVGQTRSGFRQHQPAGPSIAGAGQRGRQGSMGTPFRPR